MKKKELQKIINSILLTSYVGTLTPIYAIDKEQVSLSINDETSANESSPVNQTSRTQWLEEAIAKNLDKSVEDLSEDDYLLVTELSLSGKDILDVIPSSIGKLKNLKVLDLSGCGVKGKIPSEIENLTSLETLKLYNNEIEGSIPNGLYKLEKLKTIELMTNELSGTIKEDIKNLKDLETLNLSNNKLSGSIPNGISSLSNLTYLDFEKNNLMGSIPANIGNLNNIKHIRLNNNKLTGNIPDSIVNLNNLEHLNLAKNNLTGSIPANIGNLSNLKSINLYENNLTGNIPESIGNLTELDYLALYSNNISGNIPVELGNITNLKWLALQNNKLTGSIPNELANLKNLYFKSSAYISSFANNNLTGSIPDSWSMKKSSESFENNFLDNATNQKSIKFKDISAINLKLGERFDKEIVLNNVFIADKNGNVTNDSASNLFNIVLNESNTALLNEDGVAIKIGCSYLSASIEGSKLTTLNKITLQTYNDNVSDNWLNREVANQLNKNYTELTSEDYKKITNINLSGKGLSGAIPNEILKLSNLKEIDLSNNKFSGEIPNLSNLKNLTYVNLSNNLYSENIESVLKKIDLENTKYDLSYNQLFGNLDNNVNTSFSNFENNFINNAANQKAIKIKENKIRIKLGNRIENIKDVSVSIVDSLGKELNETLNSSFNLGIICNDSDLFENGVAVKSGTTTYKVMIKESSIVSTNNMTLETYNDSVEDNWLNREVAKQLNKNMHDIIDADYKKITTINLKEKGLAGEIPSVIEKLTNLQHLDLSNNSLHGEIPFVLVNSLVSYDFSNNNFTGNIPNTYRAKLDESKFRNNFLSGFENQKELVSSYKDLNINTEEFLNIEDILANIKLVNSDGMTIDIKDKYEIKLVSNNENILNGNYKALKPGEVYISAHLKDITTKETILVKENIILVKIKDTIAPEIKSSLNTSSWTNKPVVITVNATDNDAIEKIVLPNGTSVKADKVTFTADKNGVYEFTAYDRAGNSKNLKVTVNNIDVTKPTATITVSKPDKNNNVIINVNATDDESKVKSIIIDGKTYVFGTNNSFVVANKSTYKISVVDNAGNEYSTTINNDTEAPKVTSKVSTTAWTNKAVSVTVTATDNDAISKIVLPDGKTVSAATATYSATKNGTYTFTVYDRAGNFKDISVKVSNIDTTKPKATVSVSKPDKNNKVTITVKPTDSDSNIKSVVIDGKTYAAKATTTVSLAKKNTYKISVIDNAGNEYSTTAYGDTEAPKMTSKLSTTKWTNKAVTITITATDNDAVEKIVLPDGKTVNAKTATYSATKNGTYTFKAYDRAGNSKSLSVKVSNIDTAKPKATVSLSKIDKNNKVTITVKPTDSDSKVKSVVIDGKIYAAKTTNTVSLAKKASYKISVIDNAGNEYSTTTKCDVEAPKMTSKLSTTAWTNKAVTITVTATDNDAIEKIVLPDGKTVNAKTATYKVSKNGTYKFTAYDKTGNTKALSVKVSNIDTTKPKATVSISKPDKNNNVTITVKPTDTNSKVKTVTFDGKSYAAKTTHTFTVTKNASYKISVTDNAGNKVDYTAKVSSIPTKYTVNVSSLSVRKTMSSKGTLLGTLKKNEKVDVHEIKNGWAKITYKGNTGYVTSSSLKK